MTSLQSKLLLILLFIFLAVTAANFAIQERIVLPRFLELERMQAKTDIQRAIEAINRKIFHLDNQCWDWASWDATYAFLRNYDASYIDANLSMATFLDNELNLIQYFDSNNKLIWGKVIDLASRESIYLAGLPPAVTEDVFTKASFLQNTSDLKKVNLSGIFQTARGPMLISIRPILTSEGKGPARGTLVMAKFISNALINILKQQTQVSFRLLNYQEAAQSEPFRSISSYLQDSPFVFDDSRQDTLTVYGKFYDIRGKPALFIEGAMDRAILAQGQRTKRHALISSMLTVIAIIALLTLLLQKTIVSGIRRLTRHALSVASTGDMSLRLKLPRKDEIGTLATQFNKMLGILQERSDELERKTMALQKSIEERHKAYSTLRETREKLLRAKKMEAIGALAGGVAHDLNNILSGIVSYPELLLLEQNLDPRLREAIELIRHSGEKAAAVVADLLTISQGVATDKTQVDLNELIEDYFRSAEFSQLTKCSPLLEVTKNLEPTLSPISGSKIHLRKAFLNLILNAAEAVAGTGTIAVKTSNEILDGYLEGYGKVKPGRYSMIMVSDNGPGIDPADIERIFEPYFTKKVMGSSYSGLGLAVVWNAVVYHNAYVHVQNTPGGGATFALYFPSTRQRLAKNKIQPLSIPAGNGQSILLVDDTDTQRKIAGRILTRLGYRVTSVASGKEALAHARHHRFDLVVLDMIMENGMDGLETYRELIKFRADQKAIITSGYSETANVKAAQELGAGEFIRKPYAIDRIAVAVQKELFAEPGID